MSDIQEEQKRLYKRAEENDYKLLEEEIPIASYLLSNGTFVKFVRYEDYKKLQDRIDKAVEYINTHYLNANEPELLNILQGSDKE